MRSTGTESVLVEGGSELITALLAAGLVDRIIVGIAPVVIGAGTEAVTASASDTWLSGIHLTNRTMLPVGDDIVAAWDVVSPTTTSARNLHRPAARTLPSGEGTRR